MKGLHLLGLNAALSAMLIVAAAAEVDAQRQPAGSGPRNSIPSGGGQTGVGGATGVGGGTGVGDHDGRGDRDGRGRKRDGDIFLIDEDVVEVVEVEKEAKPDAAAAVPAAAPAVAEVKREPYKIGNSYTSLPPGCMKLIQDGAFYYLCSGDWYQQLGRDQYTAVKAP